MRIPDEVIGLWRFREVGKPRRWAATFCIGGYYYDTIGHKTLAACIKAVQRAVRKQKNSR